MRKHSYATITILFAVVVMTSCGLFDSDPTTYTLTTTASPSEGGTIIPSDGEYEDGEQINLRAEANEGWQFVRWEGDLNMTVNPVNLRIEENLMVIGHFERREYPLNITIEGEGSVQEEVIQQKTADYEHGTLVRLTAVPDEGWFFVEWSGDVEGGDRSVEITVDEEKSVTANFEQEDNGNGSGDTETEVVEVTNPETGRTWMDRNLGASRAATSSTDSEAYGDLYQWGRGADGHQKRNSPTTSTLSSSDQPGHGSFITSSSDANWDWRSPQNDDLWQGVNGINNPCPAGYRLPTEAEWNAERNSWSSNNASGALNSPLKLPLAGFRHYSSGSLFDVGSYGDYWSSSVSGSDARRLVFDSSFASMGSDIRAIGVSVRCTKD
ncbi:InlB B-repeat-containing protein [Natronogracilivirga saccharolytica]|uniref:Bacterial repeat domain-containing protein n=1 Tax=Natronogracilivirga saccharolytica TaxID=2812953 RepID=A0A8J7RPZ5_9BACT|nr:FISUMP domain-containing protein [Natronogracilivirga saccharolytica]MBP3194028.1 hypothetical protein [Natronogracilivirga saccharolytica]